MSILIARHQIIPSDAKSLIKIFLSFNQANDFSAKIASLRSKKVGSATTFVLNFVVYLQEAENTVTKLIFVALSNFNIIIFSW